MHCNDINVVQPIKLVTNRHCIAVIMLFIAVKFTLANSIFQHVSLSQVQQHMPQLVNLAQSWQEAYSTISKALLTLTCLTLIMWQSVLWCIWITWQLV